MTTNLTNSTNKVPNVPPLRFPEFTGEWEKIKVSDLLDFYSTNSLSWEQLEYDTTNLLNLHYGLIHIGLPTLIDLRTSKLPNIKKECLPTKYEICKEGDVAFADASEDTNEVAKVVEFYNLNGKKVVCGLHTIQGRDNKGKTILGYKGYALSSQPFHFQIRRLAQGTKIYAVSVKNFTESYISIPSKEEQRKIVSLLSLLDSRIETQNKIIQHLESLIKGINDNVLWQYKNKVALREILKERSERTATNNQYPIISSTAKGLFLQSEYFDKEIASADNIGYKVLRKENIVLSPQNLWLGNINYNDKYEIGMVSPSYKIFTISENFNSFYVACLLKTYRALYEYACVSEQGASVVRRNLDMEAFMEILFPIPTIEEQSRIAEGLQHLYHKLEIEKQILEKLKEQKKYLLSQMFI